VDGSGQASLRSLPKVGCEPGDYNLITFENPNPSAYFLKTEI
jgi:hypothetical protein